MPLHIKAYLHCKKCLTEWKNIDSRKKKVDILEYPDAFMNGGISPKDYSKQQFGWTKKGFQLWCTRHEKNILNIDLEGKKLKQV